jgi:hypothetical protein
MSTTPIDIITKGEWEHAFFTTYALSLSFFESQLLKEGLFRRGCRYIHILTDVKGYQMSLSERQSHRVGNEYRLSPVRVQNGIFHPKTVYLSGEEDDLLLVGSGNLTFGGYGRNIECLEVFRKSQQPGIFAQYADFLSALTSRDTLWLPNDVGLEKTLSHLRNGLPEESSAFPDAPQLLHSAQTPIGEQIASAIDQLSPIKEKYRKLECIEVFNFRFLLLLAMGHDYSSIVFIFSLRGRISQNALASFGFISPL